MRIVDHEAEPRDEWRAGVMTRMRVSAVTGSVQLCVFEQWCDPGCGAPNHFHAVEEVLTVLDGTAQVWVGESQATLTKGHSVVVPAGSKHGFSNIGTATLHVLATLASPIFEAAFDDARETPRRWVPGAAPRRQGD